MPTSESFMPDETVEHTSNCEFSLKKYYLPSFFEVTFIGQNLPQRSQPFSFHTALTKRIRSRLSLMRTSRKNTLPFESQFINNFSGIEISQSVDWDCPSLYPHFLLVVLKWCRDHIHASNMGNSSHIAFIREVSSCHAVLIVVCSYLIRLCFRET